MRVGIFLPRCAERLCGYSTYPQPRMLFYLGNIRKFNVMDSVTAAVVLLNEGTTTYSMYKLWKI